MSEADRPTTASSVPRAQRDRCTRCLRPASACICGWIRPTANEVDVLMLQHPLEVRQAKGSARLLHMSLARGTLLIGEALDAEVLLAHLNRPTPSGLMPVNVLLYPDDATALPEQTRPSMRPQHADPLPLIAATDPASLRLVVIDGTWRKSLKIIHLNPVLRTLPRLGLPDTMPSRYLIRKAPRPGQLSTLEAACQALARLEGRPDRYAPLLAAFDGFVEDVSRGRQTAMGQGHTSA